jgi:SAM-dependent methyltransferase
LTGDFDAAAAAANFAAMKVYDRAYFERWYHDRDTRILARASLERKVALAVAAAEFVLGRKLRSALDVGCGEGVWRAALRRLRPRLSYTGVDSSEYAVRRHGRRRNIRLARFGALGRLRLGGPFDLVVCSDVLHYLPAKELAPGLRAIGRLTQGLAWIEVFAAEDETIGDDVEYQARPALTYEGLIRAAGLLPIGLYTFVPQDVYETLTAFERGRER